MSTLIARFVLIVLLVMDNVAVCAQANPARGEIKLCRQTDLAADVQIKLDRSYIHLPSGLLLIDVGRIEDLNMDRSWPLTIITIKPAEMPPHVRCIVLPAIISPQSKVQSVVPSDRRYFEINAVAHLDGSIDNDVELPPSWDWTPQLYAVVNTKFH